MEIEEEILDAPDAKFGPVLADTGQRIANYFLDGIAVSVLMVVYLSVMAYGYEASFIFGAPLVILAYYILMEYFFGKTLGKMITRTKVLNEDGSRPTFKTLVGRNLARLIPFEPFSFFGNPRGWHDRLSGTIVVKG